MVSVHPDYFYHNYYNFNYMYTEPGMNFELTRGDMYCCNTELQCNNCNQTMSSGLKCGTQTTEMLNSECQYLLYSKSLILYTQLSGTVNTVLGATVGVLLVLLLVTVVALVNTCVALRLKNKQRYISA